jgi:N-acylglucosamine-6-phosphate 2-epimerase
MMAKMALAAKEGGASAIRANGKKDIKAIKQATGLPVIGIIKRGYTNSDIYITPTIKEVAEVAEAGAEIVAVDLTSRVRPDAQSNQEFLQTIKTHYPELLILADISTYEEGMIAAELGADIISTTLSGYTPYSESLGRPNFTLIEELSCHIKQPVFAEGAVNSPCEAGKCIEMGAWAVVVGGAITRPQLITKGFVDKLHAKGVKRC